MWVREDKPTTMIEDICDEKIWDGKKKVIQIQPRDQDLLPKPELGQWGTWEEQVVSGGTGGLESSVGSQG
jgi:hypothetical protein